MGRGGRLTDMYVLTGETGHERSHRDGLVPPVVMPPQHNEGECVKLKIEHTQEAKNSKAPSTLAQ